MTGRLAHRGLLLAAGGATRRWWRIMFDTAGSGQLYTSVKELEFRTTATGATGIDQTATGGTAFANSNYSGLPASGAFNGNFVSGTRYAHDNAIDSGILILGYDFGSHHDVIEVAISDGGSSQDIVGDVLIQWSPDSTTGLDGTWTAARSATISGFTLDTFSVFSVP